jgi:hypothetical protein
MCKFFQIVKFGKRLKRRSPKPFFLYEKCAYYYVYKPRARICKLLWSPGIDSQPGGSVRQPYLTYRPARLHGLAKSIPWH